MTPMISVLMPVYNGEKYLKEALESILNQTYTDFEFLIINDGSTDKSVEIIQEYDDSRIKLINNKNNMGLIYTLNRGLGLANGNYIARMDADDISLPQRIEKQISYMEKNKEVGVLSGNAISINENAKPISKKWWNTNTLPIEWQLLWENPIAHSSVMIRKEVIKEFNMCYDEKYLHSEDYDLWCRIACHSKIIRIKEVLIFYRVLDSSIFRHNINTSCNNALKSNVNYIINNFSLDYFYSHRYFTTFSQAIGEKQIINIKDVFNWFDVLFKAYSNRYLCSDRTLKHIKKDIDIRLCTYLFVINIKLFCKIFLMNKNRIYLASILLKRIKIKVFNYINILINKEN